MEVLVLLLVVLLVVAGVVVARAQAGKGGVEDSEGEADEVVELPYERKDRFLTQAERSFYGVLRDVAVSRNWDVFAKVRLEDVIEVQGGAEGYQAHRNRIKSRHLDFLLCDQETISPLLAVELNDSSHRGVERQDRDAFVSAALESAGVPLLVVSARRGYAVRELSDLVQESLGGDGAGGADGADQQEHAVVGESVLVVATSRSCPRCGSPLVERQNRKNGERFLGCSRYPACHHTQPI